MRIKKSFRKMLAMAIAAGTFAAMPLVSAEVKEYEGFGEYVMSDFETPDVAKQRAKARAEQNAMEQAGVYVESYTKVINHQVSHDEIVTMTNGILKVKDVQYKMMPTEDGKAFLIYATIKTDIDTDDISKWLAQNKQNMKRLVEQNKELQRAKEEQNKQIEDLKRQIVNIKSSHDEEKVHAKISVADQEFLSNQKLEEGFRLDSTGNHIDAIVAFSQAIELNPKNAHAYSLLGATYADLGDAIKAIENCNKAIELSPKDKRVYSNRSYAYRTLGDYMKAIEDANKAIAFDSKDVLAYINRGATFGCVGDYKSTIEDSTKAIELDPICAEAYSLRGAAYTMIDDYARAMADLTKAIELNSQDFLAYHWRGWIFGVRGDFGHAIADLTKAIELNPRNGESYYFRGMAYQRVMNTTKANEDFAMAKSLGYTP